MAVIDFSSTASETERKVKTVFVMLQDRKVYTKTSKGRQSLVLLAVHLLAVLRAAYAASSPRQRKFHFSAQMNNVLF